MRWTARSTGRWSSHHAGPDSIIWTCRYPHDTSTMLRARLWASLHVVQHDTLTPEAMRELAAWLTHQTVDATNLYTSDGASWRGMTDEEREDAMLTALGPVQLILYMRHLVDSVSLGVEAVEGVTLMHEVIASGGCECRVCRGRKGWDTTRRKEAMCKFSEVPDVSWSVWSLAAPLIGTGAGGATGQWWVYQCASAMRAGQGRVAHRRMLDRLKQEKLDEIRRQHGVR